MNVDGRYLKKIIMEKICRGFTSSKFDYPGYFTEDCFVDNVVVLQNRNDFTFLKDVLGNNIECTVEVGVDRGYYSKCIINSLSPKLHLCIDPYRKYGHAHEHSGTIDEIEEIYSHITKDFFKKEIVSGQVRFIRELSEVALPQIKENSVDFIYLDGNHFYDYVYSDLLNSVKVIKNCGIIGGHDFHGEVPAAVFKICKTTNFKICAISLDTHPNNHNNALPSFYLKRN